ncbi:MAG: MFS transporter [Halobacteria archaeon]
MIAYQGLIAPFWIDAITFLISALLLSMLTIPYSSRSAEQQNTFWRLFKEGFLYTAHATLARTLLFTRIIVALGSGIIQVVLVIFIKETMGWNDQYFGLALSTIAVGSFVSSLWLSCRGQRYKPTRLFSIGTLAVGLSFVGLALSPFFALSLLMLLLDGLADSCVVVSFSALAQQDIPDKLRGRFFSTSITFFRASVLVSALIGSSLGDSIGAQSTLIVAGLIVALGGVFAFFSLTQVKAA